MQYLTYQWQYPEEGLIPQPTSQEIKWFPVQVLKHIGLFYKDFLMGEKHQSFSLPWLITSWNQNLNLKVSILTDSLLQNVVPLVTTVP